MAKTLSVSEARAALPEILDRVTNGEEITLTRHGKPIAVVLRPDALRMRRGEAAITTAVDLRRRLSEAAGVSRPVLRRVSRKRANALVEEVRAGRVRGRARS